MVLLTVLKSSRPPLAMHGLKLPPAIYLHTSPPHLGIFIGQPTDWMDSYSTHSSGDNQGSSQEDGVEQKTTNPGRINENDQDAMPASFLAITGSSSGCPACFSFERWGTHEINPWVERVSRVVGAAAGATSVRRG